MAFTYTTRKDGRLMKRVSVNGKLRTLYSTNPKDLENQYIELKHFSYKGITADDRGLSLADWSEQWLQTYKADKQEATQKMYKSVIDLYIIPELGNYKLKFIKENDISRLLVKLNNKPRQKEITLLTITQILDKAVDNDLIYKNVAKKVKIQKHKAKEKEPLTDLAIQYLKKISTLDLRCFMVYFMLYTGVRREEVAPLLYKDIDIENKLISINKAVHWSKNRPVIKSTKNEANRKIPILDNLYDELLHLKQLHKDTDLLFPMQTNHRQVMTESSIKKTLAHVLKRINELYKKDQSDTQDSVSKIEEIKTISFSYHQLRHTYACLLHKAGIDIKEGQYLTGHKDSKVLLDIYTHLDDEDKKNATTKLNNLIKS